MYQTTIVGNLSDFGLGVGVGISPDVRDNQEIAALADRYAKCLTPRDVTDIRSACIDGRNTLGFYDGSDYKPLERVSGGSLNDFVMTVGAGLSDIQPVVVNESSCSHDCGCGAANGAIDHLIAASGEQVMNTVAALMNHEQVKSFIGLGYNKQLIEDISLNLKGLSEKLSESGWDGNVYTQKVIEANPAGVEKLAGDHDLPHHGHKEQLIEIVLDDDAVSDQSLATAAGLPDKFSLNLGRIKRIAYESTPDGDIEMRTKLVIAGLAWNLAVASNLCSPDMPIVLVSKN